MFSQHQLEQHRHHLENNVFCVDTKWPHFRLLIDDVLALAASLPPECKVFSLERTLLYGGISLFAPFFQQTQFTSVDFSPASAQERGAYNGHLVTDDDCLRCKTDIISCDLITELAANSADLIMVPNLVHHVADQNALFATIARLLKPTGTVYLFEPLVRELHQIPDDFLRYTPYGMRRMLEQHGLNVSAPKLEGGPFSAIAYCWTQALQYFPEHERQEREKWFYQSHFQELMDLDVRYTENQQKKYSSFPMAFSMQGTKMPITQSKNTNQQVENA